MSLGSLAVVNLDGIKLCTRPMGGSTDTLRDRNSPLGAKKAITTVVVEVTPTIAHCSLATVIGLGVRVRLEQALPPRFRVLVRIKPGSHASAETVSKQLADKERVAAALENDNLRTVVRRMLATCA